MNDIVAKLIDDAIDTGVTIRLRQKRDRANKLISETKAKRRRAGLFVGGKRPFGYQFGKPVIVYGKQQRTLIKDPIEYPIIAEIVVRCEAGEALKAIARSLFDRGINISHQTVWNIYSRETGKMPKPQKKRQSTTVSQTLPQPAILAASPMPVETPPELLMTLSEVKATRAEVAAIKELVKNQRQHDRNEYESGPAILRRLTSMERQLGLIERGEAPRHTRRRPMG